jgi:TonB family protein
MIEQLGLTLLHFLWQGALIGALYWLALLISRPASAGTRYNLAVGTLLLLGLTPVLTFFYLGSAGIPSTPTIGAEGAAVMHLVISATSTDQAMKLLAWTVAAWLAGVLILSLRLIIGWHYVIRLKRTAKREALLHLVPVLDRLRATMGIRQSVVMAVSERIPSPVVVGWLRPLILFPPALVTRLSPTEIEMILAHELAHIRRHDHLVNLFQIVIETLLFYHPVVALVSRRIRIERENACDDLAVQSTRDRLAYVEMLASLERFRQPGPSLTLGLHDGQILGRIRRLVEQSRPRRQLGITLPALLGLTLLAGSAGIWLMPDPDREVLTPDRPEVTERPLESPATVARALPSTPLFSLPRAVTPASRAASASVDASADTGTGSDRTQRRPAAESIAERVTRLDEATASLEPLQRASGSRSGEEAAPAADRGSRPAGPRPATDELNGIEPAMQQLAMAPAVPLSIDNAIPSAPRRSAPPELTGGDVLRQIDPDFPRKARRHGVNGIVELEFTVDQQGQVRSIGVIEERPRGWDFGEAAAAAIEQWRFEPYRRGDETVERQVRLEVEFDLAEICPVSTGSRLPRC